MPQTDVVIAGAGIIGLSCALALQACGMRVTVLERGSAIRQASWAAAGMLAAHDPANPAALTTLAELSLKLYPAYLERIASQSGMSVPLETQWTLERVNGHDTTLQHDLPHLQAEGFVRVAEQSLDPRKLAVAALAATCAVSIDLREHTHVKRWSGDANGVTIETDDSTYSAAHFVDCTGAWSPDGARPAKGQMLRVHAPGALTSPLLGNIVVRTPDIYLVPRLDGTVVIGATVENAGFDTTTHDADLAGLRSSAATLIRAMSQAPEVERWAGLRPDTPDHLPLLGQTRERCFIAAGHFRNGILLAPATALVLSQLIQNLPTSVDLACFSATRFMGE